MTAGFLNRRILMTTQLPSIPMTPHDYRRLTRTAQELAKQAHPLAAQLVHELRRAAFCEPDELPDDVVTLDTFVTYRIGGEDMLERRMLIHPDDRMWPPAELSVLTPVGLSLLGLRAGYRMPLIGSDEPLDVCVEAVGPSPDHGQAPAARYRRNLASGHLGQCSHRPAAVPTGRNPQATQHITHSLIGSGDDGGVA
jgi:regulator of nucleoside diphosphate kinase